MKLSKKQIEMIINNTKKDLKGIQRNIEIELGTYQTKQSNWSYHAGWDLEGNLIVTVFGEVM